MRSQLVHVHMVILAHEEEHRLSREAEVHSVEAGLALRPKSVSVLPALSLRFANLPL